MSISKRQFPIFDSLIYNEIKQFEPYEFSTCIAYEAAIRIPCIRKALIEFSDLYNKGKSQYCRYELQKMAAVWHHKLDLYNYGFDLEASIFFMQKRNNSDYQREKKIISTPIKYQEDRYTGNIIRIIKMSNGLVRRRDIQTGMRKDTMNWDEFGVAPIFVLDMIMKRPRLKLSIRHQTFYTPMNFALQLPELVQQLTVIKEQYDKDREKGMQARTEHESNFETLHEVTNQQNNEKGIPHIKLGFDVNKEHQISEYDKMETLLKFIAKLTKLDDENLMSAGESLAGVLFSGMQIDRKKHNPSKVVAEVFFVYDSLTFLKKFNEELLKEEDAAKEEICKTYYGDQAEEAIFDLKKEYEKKYLSESQLKDKLYAQIKDKFSETRGNKKRSTSTKRVSNIIDERWSFAKMLIDDKGYESLI
jgi:hypothetical protein